MNTSERNKIIEYASKIGATIEAMFDEEAELKIDLQELEEGDNLTLFMHALANAVPAEFHRRLTGDDVNYLEFNHLANNLCFQYMNHGVKSNEDENGDL